MNEENSSPEPKISLSPESGSLFHYYHSKLAATNMDDETEKNSVASKFPKRETYHIGSLNKSPRTWEPSSRSSLSTHFPSQRLAKYPLLEMTDFVLAQNEVEKHCTKIFSLKDFSNSDHALWILPPPEQLYSHETWKVEELLKMKENLNQIKGQLERFDIDSWHKHTQMCNPAQKISLFVRNRAKPELLTQAFLKFYEILHAFPVVPEEAGLPDSSFKSLHLCEAPGAFIVALNHYLALQRPNIEWRWTGNTLNPHFEGTPTSECIADDRFILHTSDHWYFGKDDTGNLMSVDYLEELIDRVGKSAMDLVTADGSIDCQRNPAEQETMTNYLHFCEVYSALCTLRDGGSLVLKKFTIFEAESICLVYLVCCCFSSVDIYKPITSKLGNSEVYLVAQGFKSLQIAPYMTKLKNYYGKKLENVAMFSRNQIPSTFFTQIIKCSSFFKNHQVEAIERNIQLYNNETEKNYQYTDLLKAMILNKFEGDNICKPIGVNQRLVPQKMEWDKNIIPECHNTKWGGQIKKKTKTERLDFLSGQYNIMTEAFYIKSKNETDPVTCDYRCNTRVLNDSFLNFVALKTGKRFHFVYSSRFCHVNLLQILIQYLEECLDQTELAEVLERHVDLELRNLEAYKTLALLGSQNATSTIQSKPNALLLDEGQYPAPHSCHKAFDNLFALIKDGKLAERTDVVIVNCPIYTRLQFGLFHVISCLFEKVEIYEPTSIPLGSPFFVFVNFLSIEKGHGVVNSVKYKNDAINEIFPLNNLIKSYLYVDLCRYNSLYCLSQIGILKSLLK